jgi:hypothetical protein
MKKLSRFVPAALALILGSATAAFADSPPPPAKQQVSAAAAKDLQAAQKAMADKRYDEEITDLDKVKANTKKSEYDEFVMNEFYFTAYAGLKKYEEAQAPLEAIIASKYMSPDELKQRLPQAAVLAYQLKNYPKAIEFGNRAIEAGGSNDQLQLIISQAYYLTNDYKNTDRFVDGVVGDEIKAGQVPTVDILQLGLSAAAKQNDAPRETHWLELMVSYHPTPEYWEDLVGAMYKNKLTDTQNLQLYRLIADVGVLKHGSDYAEMAQLALDAGSPGEAVTTLTNGFAANAFTDAAEKNRNQHLLDSARKQAASDQPTLPKIETEARNAATGEPLVGAGKGFFSYGDYAKAVTDISAGLAKGNVKNEADDRLLLGIAQLKAGDKDSAVKTFQSVKGDAVYERLAALWILRAKT